MAVNVQPNQVFLDQYINDGYKNKFSTFAFLNMETLGKDISPKGDTSLLETWRIPVSSIFTEYWSLIGIGTKYVVKWDLSNHLHVLAKYKNAPKTLSYDLYGTVEFWTGLLEINRCRSITDFNGPVFNIFTSEIKSVLEDILILSGQMKNIITNG